VSENRRRLRIDLAYDGTDFAGWQLQPGQRSVQGVLEHALGRLDGDRPVRARAAGRTDAGVHARGQVVDALVVTREADADLLHALRRMLPRDLRPTALATVDLEFHARYHALSKTYRYSLDLAPHADPFRARYALHRPGPLDLDAVERALRLLPGRRDWSGFAGAASTVEDHVRHLTRASLERPERDVATLTFTANGFLNYMVRNLVGTLLEIATGRRPPEDVVQILESRDRTLAGPTAPARGLCLERVVYPGDT
jgi:tRNA pseudouridine38-40 synthase